LAVFAEVAKMAGALVLPRGAKMTYSIIAQCPRTGAFGGAVGTSSLAVGNRCLHVRHGVGAFLSQHRTDPRLGEQGLELLAAGSSAEQAMAIVSDAPDIGWRQLAALDTQGRVAVHHGERLYSIATDSTGDRCIAIGNILANEKITAAMIEAFMASVNDRLESRLVEALEAGRDAGGEILEPLRSAALRVSGPDGMDRCDLRVDRADEAVGAMRDLLTAYGDQEELLRNVAFVPETVPVARSMFEASVNRIQELGLQERFPTAERRAGWTLKG
jgi:uncharacterized Ntn-hydrolase superfamily protein